MKWIRKMGAAYFLQIIAVMLLFSYRGCSSNDEPARGSLQDGKVSKNVQP